MNFSTGTNAAAKLPPKAEAKMADPMLLACRDMALQILMQSFDGVFSRLEEVFFELAEKTHDRNLRDVYFSARAETQTKRSRIAEEFKQRFIQAFNNRANDLNPNQRASGFYKIETPISELSLVANDEYEENLSAGRMANALKETGGDAMRQVEQRLARLLPFDVNDANNPMSPEAICEALLAACRQLESGVDARLVAIKAFEDQLASTVSEVYTHVNDFLIQRNIQPVNPGARMQRQGARGARPAGAQGNVGAGNSSATDDGMVSVSIPAALAHHFEMLASGQTAQYGAEHFQGQLTFLNQLQQRVPAGLNIAGLDGMLSERDNLLTRLVDSQWAQKLPQVDAMTLNLVALMFDHMFEDSRLPDAVKGLVGRLQIPVLKVALLDPTFFSHKQHPARLLVDRIVEVALNSDSAFEEGTPGYEKLAELVTWVVDNFEDDVSLFSAALAKLDEYQNAEAEAIVGKLASQAEVLAAAELQELAIATSDAVVRSRTFQRQLPPLIKDFLEQWWIKALQAAYGADGEYTPKFAGFVKVMDDLLWSLDPKSGPEDRLKLVNLLPPMLKTLDFGAGEVGMSHDARQRFFSELVHCHAAAIRNGAKIAASPELQIPSPTNAGAASTVASIPVSPVAEAPVPAAATEDVQVRQVLPGRGDWIELLDVDGTPHRLRLTWISPQATRFIFTNRAGENGRTFTRAEVAKLMEKGFLRIPETVSNLTDQVLGQMRESLAA